jgi:hypothetical protein
MLLLRDIAAAADATDWMSLESFRTLTHIRGRRNAHLAEPDGYDSRTGNYHQRRTPLPLDVEVHGDFVTLAYCGHGPWAILEDHDSLAELERSILGGAGILNGFTEFVLAFVNGNLRSYEVRDGGNQLVAKDGMRVVVWNELDPAKEAACRVIWTGG